MVVYWCFYEALTSRVGSRDPLGFQTSEEGLSHLFYIAIYWKVVNT